MRDVRVAPLLSLGAASPVDHDKIITVAVQRLPGIVLDHVEGASRLWLTSDMWRQEIGACLVPSERDWLFAVLQQWRQGIDQRAARDTSIIDAEMASWKKRWSDPETGIMEKRRP